MNEFCACIPLVDPPVVVRDLDDHAIRTLKHRGRQTPKLHLALACGMTTRQFKKLTPKQQAAVWRAISALGERYTFPSRSAWR